MSAPRGRGSDGLKPVASPGGDAVDQAHQWLAAHGVDLPESAASGAPAAEDKPQARKVSVSTSGDDADDEERARTIVLRQLTGQARTRSELQKKLAAKEIPETVANEVLDRFVEVGLVDDAAFATAWVESRQQRKNLSRRALRQELQRKGVDSELISEAVAEIDGDDEFAAAKELAERKLRPMARLSPEVRKRRLAGVLARRGFNPGLIHQVLAEVLNDAREL